MRDQDGEIRAMGRGPAEHAAEDESSLSRDLARRFREDLWNTGDLSIADAIIHRDCVVHARVPFDTGFTTGPEAVKQLVRFYHFAFSDIAMKVEQVVAEGPEVAVRWSGSGRQTGDVLGVAATGRDILTNGIDMLRIEEGRIAEGWVSWDVLSLLEQTVGPEQQADALDEGSQSGFLTLVSILRRGAGS